MSIFSRFKMTSKTAKTIAAWLPAWIKVSWMETDFLALARQGYKASSAVANCVRALAFSFPEPPLVAYRKNGEDPAGPTDPLQSLIKHPNPDMGEAEFMQFAITYASIGGNVYVWKERAKNGKVLALWPFSDKDVSPIPGHDPAEGFVQNYEFNVGDGEKIPLSKRDVVHWKWMVDPEQPWKGIGALEFAIRDVQNDTESSRYTYAMFRNNAIPPVAITAVEGDELDDAKIERLKAAWMKRYGGGNQGVPAFLEAGMTIQKLGWNMQELNLSELKNIPESRICGAFGVPPSIAMLYVGLKRSDYGDGNARKSFTETTLVALWRTFADELTAALSDEFGGGYELRFDLNRVKALQENLNELWTRLSSAAEKGLITRAEFRRGVGLRATKFDDVYRTNMINGWEPANREPGNPAEVTIIEPESPADATNSEPENPEDADLLEPDGEDGKARKRRATAEKKEVVLKAAGAVYARALQRIRLTVTRSMAADLDGYFASLADRVVSRAGKSLGNGEMKGDLPSAGDLLTAKDESDLAKLLKRWYVAVMQSSWETINLSLGLTVAFDLAEPAVTNALEKAGGLIRGTRLHPENEITRLVRSQLQDALKYGNEHGWSIGELVRGDENQAGIRAIVEETYKGRANTIARTELGNAQNAVTAERYKASNVQLVGILDNGETDDDEECQIANGQIWTLEFFDQNSLEHPNCTRCAYPVFENIRPDRE